MTTEAGWDEVMSDEQRRNNAQVGAWLGISAMTLCLLGWCTCQVSTLVAAVPAGIAVWLARTSADVDDGETRAYSRVGLVSASIVLLYLLLILVVLALYVGLYVLLFAMMFVTSR